MTPREALRSSAAFTRPDHLAVVEVRGRGAFAALDRALPSDLFLHDGQARPSLLLDDRAAVVADVLLARLDGTFLLVADGVDAAALVARIRDAAAPGAELEVEDAADRWGVVSLHGPFAWEVGARWLGRRIAGLPPLGVLRTSPETMTIRGGKTGEYGYEILVARRALPASVERLVDVGRAFDLAEAPSDVVDAGALEAGGFARRLVCASGAGLSPFELQLQWRLSRTKDHVGGAAVASRAAAVTSRVAWFRADAHVAVGARVEDPERGDVGAVLAAVSGTAHPTVGVALLDLAVSHAGFAFRAGAVDVTTASPPLLVPRSVSVQPDVHAYRP